MSICVMQKPSDVAHLKAQHKNDLTCDGPKGRTHTASDAQEHAKKNV
jgi:hypothetical protein